MTVYVRRASGLVEPYDVPQLTLEAAVDRGWHRGGRLLEPDVPAGGPWLQTEPSIRPRRGERWAREFIYGGPPWGPLEAGGCSV